MPVSIRHIVTIATLTLAGFALGGCGSINERITPTVVDSIPHWAGGMPNDVPPRRGTPEYDAYMKERERKRLEPAVATDGSKPPFSAPSATAASSPSNASTSSAMALDPVH
jgi:hypothetical protein